MQAVVLRSHRDMRLPPLLYVGLSPWVGLIPLYALWVSERLYVYSYFLDGYGVNFRDPKVYAVHDAVAFFVGFAGGTLWIATASTVGAGIQMLWERRRFTRTIGVVASMALAGQILFALNLLNKSWHFENPLTALRWFMD